MEREGETETDSPSSFQIPCDKCDFVCETASALIRHREFHGNKGSFECHICDYAASTKQVERRIVYHVSTILNGLIADH